MRLEHIGVSERFIIYTGHRTAQAAKDVDRWESENRRDRAKAKGVSKVMGTRLFSIRGRFAELGAAEIFGMESPARDRKRLDVITKDDVDKFNIRSTDAVNGHLTIRGDEIDNPKLIDIPYVLGFVFDRQQEDLCWNYCALLGWETPRNAKQLATKVYRDHVDEGNYWIPRDRLRSMELFEDWLGVEAGGSFQSVRRSTEDELFKAHVARMAETVTEEVMEARRDWFQNIYPGLIGIRR